MNCYGCVSDFRGPKLVLMFCLSIVYVYKECFNFVYVVVVPVVSA